MGFRDESEAARARIESLERALEGTQRTLDAVRAELDAERASHGNSPHALATQRYEIDALKARLEARLASAERMWRPRSERTRRVTIAFLVLVVVGMLAGLQLAGNERAASRLRALAVCVDEMHREGAVDEIHRGSAADLCLDEPAESVQPLR